MSANANQNRELSRGHKQYDAKIKDINGILNKIETIFDVSEYRSKVREIEDSVKNKGTSKNDMLYYNFRLDFEDMLYSKYIEEINQLIEEINDKYVPFYELYMLITRINSDINASNDSFNDEGIKEVIDSTIRLINRINNLNTHNIKEKNRLIDEAYKTIYKVLLFEELFDRSDVLDYINKKNISVNRESIGRLLAKDIDLLDRNEIIDEDLRTIRTEGLGYDYLNSHIVKKVAIKTVGSVNSEYQRRKQQAIRDFDFKAQILKNNEAEQTVKLGNNKSTIRSYKVKKSLLRARVLSLLLVPFITFGAGRYVGKKTSDQITEYKTITRSVDLNTGTIIGEPEVIYDEKETTYVATVVVYTPWKQNTISGGYTRNATAYEFIAPDDIGEDYHLTIEEIENNVREKYRYVEAKEILDETDSMTQQQVVITETYQDKQDNRKSIKYVLPFSIVGAGIGVASIVALLLFHVMDLHMINDRMISLDSEIQGRKYENEEIKKRLLKLREEAISLKEQYKNIENKYGKIDDNVYYVDKNNKILMKHL